MGIIVDFLAAGGFKLLILAIIVVSQIAKNRAKKAAQERQPVQKLPNALPSQLQTPTSSAKNDLGSPWSSSSNPFDGAKQ